MSVRGTLRQTTWLPLLRRYAAAISRLSPAAAATTGGSAPPLPCQSAQLSPGSGLIGSLLCRRTPHPAPHAMLFSVRPPARGAPPVLFTAGPPVVS